MSTTDETQNIEYHKAVEQYNRDFAEFARKYSREAKHPTIRKWAYAIAKQHEEYALAHLKAGKRLKTKERLRLWEEQQAQQNQQNTSTTEDEQ